MIEHLRDTPVALVTGVVDRGKIRGRVWRE